MMVKMKLKLLVLGIALLSAIQLCSCTPPKKLKLNNRPIIAVIAQRYPKTSNQSYIAASYVKYLESAGARVVPIPHYYSPSKIAELFKYVNGVLYPGGGINWFVADYYKHGKQFWNLAIDANNKGDYFPVWGTCLGFEALHFFLTDKYLLNELVGDDVANYLNFTSQARSSRLFRNMPKDLYTAIQKEDITYNHHHKGVSPDTYKKNAKLSAFFKVLSTNFGEHGNEYVSTIEAFKYPIYGVQYHPEKNNFEYGLHFKGVPHTANAIRVSQYMANFFVNEARKNFHHFPSEQMEIDHLIYQHDPVHTAVKLHKGSMSHFEQCYIFKE